MVFQNLRLLCEKKAKGNKSKTKGGGGVCHTVAALPFTLKGILKGKRRIMKIQIFHHAKI
jgi:hypothetical protein